MANCYRDDKTFRIREMLSVDNATFAESGDQSLQSLFDSAI